MTIPNTKNLFALFFGPNIINTIVKICFIIFLSTFVSFSSLYAGTESFTREEQKALYEAQEAIKKQQYQKARQGLLEYLHTHSDKKASALFYYALGNAWYLDKNLNKAYQVYEKGYGFYPSSFLLCSNFAAVAYELQKYQKAGGLFEKAYQLSKPAQKELLYQAGTAYYQAGSFDAAKSVIKHLIKSQKKIKDPWLKLLIQICLESKDWKEAEHVLENFLTQHPTEATYWKLLSQIQLRGNDYQSAVATLEILYKINPPTQKELEELANLYFYLNAPLKAIPCLKKAYGGHPNASQCEKLSRAWIQVQQFDKGIHYLDLAIKQEPSSNRLLEKGKLYYESGQWDKAISALKSCVRSYPNNEFAHLLLGYSAMEKENFELARQSFLRASKGKKYRQEAISALNTLER